MFGGGEREVLEDITHIVRKSHKTCAQSLGVVHVRKCAS